MSWKFWDRSTPQKGQPSLSGPKNLPNTVGRTLVVRNGENPDWVWTLKCVQRQREGVANRYDVRIFDENSARERKVSVRNYTSLDQVPELILFEGWYDKKSNEAEVVKRNQPAH